MILRWLAWVRDALRWTYYAVMPLRVAIVVAALIWILFGYVPQGQDAIRLAGETKSWLVMILFPVAVILLATVVWYSSRVLMRVDPPSRWLRDWAPRILGGLVFLGIALDVAKAIDQYDHKAPGLLHIYAWLFGILAVLFPYLAYKRRSWLGILEPDRETLGEAASSKPRLFTFIALLIVSFFLAATFVPQYVGLLGAPTVLALSAIGWVVLGALIVRAGQRLRIPIFTCILLLAFGFSRCNDNHVIATKPIANLGNRPTLQTQFDVWSKALQAHYGAGPRPVFIVATEGGGIRAGYWTAVVLAALHDQNPKFTDHVFAISSVSGGSLGATAYAGLAQIYGTGKIRGQARDALRPDALGPLLAAMFQPDLAQRFLPWPFLPDRAAALEGAWEHGWRYRTVTPKKMSTRFGLSVRRRTPEAPGFGFDDGFLQTFALQPRPLQPSLFLNATVVERGLRGIVSNVQIESAAPRADEPASPFSKAYDVMAELGGDVKISTATHMSARFPYFSPAGTIRASRFGSALQKNPRFDTTCIDCPELDACVSCNRDCCHVVDGGYFENSGSATAMEIFEAIRKPASERNFHPIVLIISARKEPEPLYKPQQRAAEILTPPMTLVETWQGRAKLARAQLQNMTAFRPPLGGLAHSFVHFVLTERSTALPLGWALAEQSRNAIDANVGLKDGPNWTELTQVIRLVDPAAQPIDDPVAREAWEKLPPVGDPCKPDLDPRCGRRR